MFAKSVCYVLVCGDFWFCVRFLLPLSPVIRFTLLFPTYLHKLWPCTPWNFVGNDYGRNISSLDNRTEFLCSIAFDGNRRRRVHIDALLKKLPFLVRFCIVGATVLRFDPKFAFAIRDRLINRLAY